MSSVREQPFVWVPAGEIVRCAQLAVDNWKASNTAKKEAAILRWQHRKTGFFRKRFYTREEAIQLTEENWLYDITPQWVDDAIILGRAALLAPEGQQLQLSPLQVSWLWPEIDPRKP